MAEKPSMGLLLLGSKMNAKKPSRDSMTDDSEESDESDSIVAAEAVLDAVEQKDKKLLDQALRSHYTLCRSSK